MSDASGLSHPISSLEQHDLLSPSPTSVSLRLPGVSPVIPPSYSPPCPTRRGRIRNTIADCVSKSILRGIWWGRYDLYVIVHPEPRYRPTSSTFPALENCCVCYLTSVPRLKPRSLRHRVIASGGSTKHDDCHRLKPHAPRRGKNHRGPGRCYPSTSTTITNE